MYGLWIRDQSDMNSVDSSVFWKCLMRTAQMNMSYNRQESMIMSFYFSGRSKNV